MQRTTTNVPVKEIELDRENPRIRAALERQGIENPSDEQLSFHLSAAATSAGSGGHGYRRLKASIIAAGRAYQPVSLVRLTESESQTERKYMCLDGNTRVAIYRELAETEVPGDWTRIPAEILDPESEQEKVQATEHIRMISHIVGAREWSPYRQAKYLHELRNKECFSWQHIVALCGGDVTQSALKEDIDAYELIEDYRTQVNPGHFKEHRFSAYRELIKCRGIKALEEHDLGPADFHTWVADGVLTKDEQVRHLRSVLAEPEAKKILCGGKAGAFQTAIDYVNDKRRADRRRTEHAEHLRESTLLDLVRALSVRLEGTTLAEVGDLEKRPEELVEIVNRLRAGAERLASFIRT